jgi:VanZ family protein
MREQHCDLELNTSTAYISIHTPKFSFLLHTLSLSTTPQPFPYTPTPPSFLLSNKQRLTHPAAFTILLLLSAALGVSPPDYTLPSYAQSDKALHFVAFFALTTCFYWILETSRRKVLQVTFIVVTLGLGVASEVVQGMLPVSSHTFGLLLRMGGWRDTRGERDREGRGS